MGMKKRSRRSQTSFGNSASIQSSWLLTDPGMNEYPTRERRGSVSRRCQLVRYQWYVTLDR